MPQSPKRRFPALILGSAAVIALHAAFARGALDLGSNLVLLAANLLAWAHFLYARPRQWRFSAELFLAGVLVLYMLFLGLSFNPMLLAMLLIAYSTLFRFPVGLGVLAIFILAFVYAAPYQLPVFALAVFGYLGVVHLARRHRSAFAPTMFGVGYLFLAVLLLPIIYLVMQSTPQTVWLTWGDPEVRAAMGRSLATSLIATAVAVILGTPLAYALGRGKLPGGKVLDVLLDVPIVMPQSVIGIALLTLLGPKTPVGMFVHDKLGLTFDASWLAIITAQVFVSAPFYVRTVMSGFAEIDPDLDLASRSLGAGEFRTFRRVWLPLVRGPALAGIILAWARAISEFGALMIVAYTPQTAPIMIYDRFEKYGRTESRPVAVIMIILCLGTFLSLRVLHHFWTRRPDMASPMLRRNPA